MLYEDISKRLHGSPGGGYRALDLAGEIVGVFGDMIDGSHALAAHSGLR